MTRNSSDNPDSAPDLLGDLIAMQRDAARAMFTGFSALAPQGLAGEGQAEDALGGKWGEAARQIRGLWSEFLDEQGLMDGDSGQSAQNGEAFDPARWLMMVNSLAAQAPPALPASLRDLPSDAMAIWQGVFEQFLGSEGDEKEPGLPRSDRRFAADEWRDYPAFALLHQTYLMLAEYFTRAVREMKGIAPEQKQQLKFASAALIEALSPANFLATNPVVLKRTIETGGQNLVKGMRHLIDDLKRGQLTHSDPDAFTLGENLAATEGKVVYETPLFQLIQYTPTTSEVLEVPLVIFPPWINRFYILDLTPQKSFVKWALDAGISTFMVSWKSADASMKDVVWDDYIRAQIEAIDMVRKRLKVKNVHTIGYCVAGTTLAATLAILARRGEADKVKSATFFTAQVDFEKSGELKHFIDDGQLTAIGALSRDGYLDGRYLAATFNALRSKDLIWNYVVNNYLLGEDYPAFDLLHWNGDVTNLPAKWHSQYLRDLYRDNRLVVPDSLEADGTRIDLSRIKTPCYIQAGKEDHIAPAKSVWRLTRHVKGPVTFVLAGSGHIAGVVNPPAANKYQYWTGDAAAASLDEFVAGAKEHKGSWWPHWLKWLKARDPEMIAAKGKRVPGKKGDKTIEDAPGRYVKAR